MTDVNIFEAGKEVEKAVWAKFINPGDAIQGTYVGCILNQVDGYGNEQNVYQVKQKDGKTINVGFGLNKKFIVDEMKNVRFGQIIGFKFNGKVQVKNKVGQMVSVNDYSLFQDPKIVDEEWIKDNQGNMPVASKAVVTQNVIDQAKATKEFNDINSDVPFSTPGSITNEDKLKVITKLAMDKLGATDSASVKETVMAKTSMAFLPMNYEKIIELLNS